MSVARRSRPGRRTLPTAVCQGCAVTCAMTLAQAYAIAERMGWTRTQSWQRGVYVANAPGKRLLGFLKPFRWGRARGGVW